MKKLCKYIIPVVVGLLLTVSTTGFAGQTNNVNVYVSNNDVPIEQTGSTSNISWEKGSEASLEVVGFGAVPPNANNVAQARALARRAAIVDGYRNLAEAIQGVQVDAETTMQNLTIANDTVKVKVSSLVQGAKIIREVPQADGSYQIVMGIPLYGPSSISAIALPAIQPDVIKTFPSPSVGYVERKPENTSNQNTNIGSYTGVIIDARGLGLESTFSPRVYDETGRIIYGNMYIDTDFAISQGMVDYAISPEMAQAAEAGQSRAGSKPILVKAIEVKENNCNVVISKADADMILAKNNESGFLKKCAVVFVK